MGFTIIQACSHIVVSEFARISNFLNFLYCFSIIESNQRSLLGGAVGSSNNNAAAASNGNGGVGGTRNQDRNALEAYFPFDPYKLKRSMKWMEGYYVEWEPVPGLDPEESEEEEEDEEDEEEEDEESGGEGDGDEELTEVDEDVEGEYEEDEEGSDDE